MIPVGALGCAEVAGAAFRHPVTTMLFAVGGVLCGGELVCCGELVCAVATAAAIPTITTHVPVQIVFLILPPRRCRSATIRPLTAEVVELYSFFFFRAGRRIEADVVLYPAK